MNQANANTPRLYLDANATTAPLPEVQSAVAAAQEQLWGNPSSQHVEGRAARRAIANARAQVAALLDCGEDWLTFTSGGSEAINLWLRGRAAAANETRRIVISSAGEHPAVAATLKVLAEQGIIDVALAASDKLGRVSAAALAEAIAASGESRILAVAIIAAHNETGGCQDLAALAQVCRQHGVACFFDGVQWTGKRAVSLRQLDADGWAVSFHKFGGPKGVGVLAARPGLLTAALITGGPQEKRRRAGTENTPAIVGAGVAADTARLELSSRQQQWRQILDKIRSELTKLWPGVEMLHDSADGLAQTLLLRFPGWRGGEMVQRLDLEGVAASTGSACASGASSASAALLGLGMAREQAEELVRLSLPPRPAPDTAERLLATLTRIRASA